MSILRKEEVDSSMAPFVVEFTLAVIKTLRGEKFVRPSREVIHSDMVPKFSEHVIQASMNQRQHPVLTSGIMARRGLLEPMSMNPLMQKNIPQANMDSQVQQPTDPGMAWKKIEPLLRDPTVTHIECSGQHRPLMVSRAGMKQVTKITLSEIEIKNILETIAHQAHIPLLEGVFKAATSELIVNAIISEIIGSKFVIKKNTPYSLLR